MYVFFEYVYLKHLFFLFFSMNFTEQKGDDIAPL
jgi:hypothetical protein